MFWCTILKQWIRCFGPNDQPNFQPVTLNILPALPMVTVLSHIPGNVAATHQITCEMLSLLCVRVLVNDIPYVYDKVHGNQHSFSYTIRLQPQFTQLLTLTSLSPQVSQIVSRSAMPTVKRLHDCPHRWQTNFYFIYLIITIIHSLCCNVSKILSLSIIRNKRTYEKLYRQNCVHTNSYMLIWRINKPFVNFVRDDNDVVFTT